LYKYSEVLVTFRTKEHYRSEPIESQETQITPLTPDVTNKVHRTTLLFWVTTQHNQEVRSSVYYVVEA
jgi:hypothetical protein